MKSWLLCLVLLFYLNSRSQNIAGVENFLLASQQDQEILVQEYFNPLFNALQISMGEGWVKSAKTHKKLGFDFTFSLSAINVPKRDLSFSNQIFNNLSSTSTHSPTIFGSDSNGTYLVEFYPPDSDYSMSTSFEIPNGHNDLLSSGRLILPNLQLSIGVPFRTELIVRYMPETTNKGAKFKSIGLGIKHSISQYFKASKITPFHLSVLANNSRLEGGYNFGTNSQIPGENQSVDLMLNGLNSDSSKPYCDIPKSTSIGNLLQAMANKYLPRGKELKVKEIGLQPNENLHEQIVDGGPMSNEMEQYTIKELEKMI